MTNSHDQPDHIEFPDPQEVVREFFARWTQSKSVALASFDEFFTPDTIWENVGVATTVGIEEARSFVADNPPDFDIMVAEITHIASTGRFVFTERVDDFFDTDGVLILRTRGAGVAEVIEGKIVAMREYFLDPTPGA